MEPITPSAPTPPNEQPTNPEIMPSTSSAPTPVQATVQTTAPAPTVFSPTSSNSTATPSASAPTPVTSPAPAEATPAATPVIGQPVVNGTAGTVPPNGYNTPSTAGKPRWLLPAAVLAALVVLGGGFVFGYYLPNQPSSIFDKSLVNSGKAIDKLVNFSKDQTSSRFNSVSFNGNLKIKSADVSSDVTLSGAYDKVGNGNVKVGADVAGGQYSAELRSVKKAGNDSPDLYVQATGIKTILDAEGMNNLDNLDGQWISIDHTLVDTYKKNLETASGTDASSMPTNTQVMDAVVKIQTVNKQYLFSADKNTAVLVNQKFVGKEKMDGRSVDHFTTGYNKDHLEAYAKALKAALDSSSLPSVTKKSYDSAFDSLISAAKSGKSDYTFDLYADTSSKLVHAVTFTDTTNKNSKVTLSQNYTGGNNYPFAIAIADKSDSGQAETGRIDFSFNPQTNKYNATLALNADGTTASGTFDATSSNATVQVTAPASSKSVNDVLSELGLSSADASALSGDTSTSSDLFTLTQ